MYVNIFYRYILIYVINVFLLLFLFLFIFYTQPPNSLNLTRPQVVQVHLVRCILCIYSLPIRIYLKIDQK